MYFLLKMGIFQPAMLVYQRVPPQFRCLIGYQVAEGIRQNPRNFREHMNGE